MMAASFVYSPRICAVAPSETPRNTPARHKMCIRDRFDVFQRTLAADQVVSLEHKAYLAVADGRQVVVVGVVDVHAVQHVLPRCGLVQHADNEMCIRDRA